MAAAKKWKTGVPSDPSNNNGALISKEHLEKVMKVLIAVKEQISISKKDMLFSLLIHFKLRSLFVLIPRFEAS